MSRNGSGAANHVSDALGDDLFVAQSVLHGANCGGISEDVCRLLDGRARVQAFSREDAEIARRDLLGIAADAQLCGEIGGAGDFESRVVDRPRVFFGDIVGVNLDV